MALEIFTEGDAARTMLQRRCVERQQEILRIFQLVFCVVTALALMRLQDGKTLEEVEMFWWWSLCRWCVSPLLFCLNVNRLAYGYKRWRLPANEA
jgi:hypothetical protein